MTAPDIEERELQFDVFRSTRYAHQELSLKLRQTANGEEVLVHETSMNGFDPGKLGWIQNDHGESSGLRGGRVKQYFARFRPCRCVPISGKAWAFWRKPLSGSCAWHHAGHSYRPEAFLGERLLSSQKAPEDSPDWGMCKE